MSNDIECESSDWPIDPENNSNIEPFSTVFKMRLDYPFGKPKRLLLELFIMINMAQLMYTAMLAFTKTAIIAAPAGTPIVILALFRHAALVIIELAR